jgi:RPA family protein
MKTEAITQLLVVGRLSIDYWKAQEAISNAKHAYHEKIREYEREHGAAKTSIDPAKPEHAAIIEYTSVRFQAVKTARANAYKINRRLQSACRKFARLSACESSQTTQA